MAAAKKKRTVTDVDASGKEIIKPVTASVHPIKKPVIVKVGAPGFFSRITSNVKGRDMDIPLGRCTAITSPDNRVGKTAVLDAFRLALTGKHPIGPHAVNLAGLTADGSLPWANLTGVTVSSGFAFPGNAKTGVLTTQGEFQNLRPEDSNDLLPMVRWQDLLTMGTAKAREAMFGRFGDAEALAHATVAPADLSPEQVAIWDRAIKGDGRLGTLDIVEKLAAAGTWLRSHKSGLSRELKALEEEKQRLHEMLNVAGTGAATEDLLRDVQKKIDIHRTLANTSLMQSRAQQSESRLTDLIAQYEQLKPLATEEEKVAARAAVDAAWPTAQLQSTVETGTTFLKQLQNQVRLFTLVTKLREMLKQGNCIVCTQSPNTLGALDIPRTDWQTQVDQLVIEAERQLAVFRLGVEAAEHSLEQDQSMLRDAINGREGELMALESGWAQALGQRQRIIMDLKAAKLTYEASLEMLKEAGVVPAPAESMEVLQQQLTGLQAARQDAGRATTLATLIRTKKLEQDDTKTVESQLGVRLNELVAGVRLAAQTAVNLWMPPGFKASLMLENEDGKADCSWEVIGADGRPHPKGAASGAEYAALTVAIACAWSEGQAFRFLLLDDSDLAGFNAKNVAATLTMVAKAVDEGKLTQALVAWSRPGEIPDEGWNVVQL